MRQRTSLAGLASDFDEVEGASKVADEAAPIPALPEESIQEPEIPSAAVEEPPKVQERPKRVRAERAGGVDEALERLARSKPSEYLNARVPRYLDDEIDAEFQAEKNMRRDAADPNEIHRALTKQSFVAELLVLGLASHRARAQKP